MKQVGAALAAIMILSLFAGCGGNGGGSAPAPPSEASVQSVSEAARPAAVAEQGSADSRRIADTFFDYLTAGDYQRAHEMFSAEMLELLGTPEDTEAMWAQILAQTGEFQSNEEPSLTHPAEGMDTYGYPASFAKGRYILQVTVQDGKVSGLYALAGLAEAEAYLEALLAGDFEKVYEMSDDALRSAYKSVEGLETTWNGILAQTGAYLSSEPAQVFQQADSVLYSFRSQFENGAYFAQVSIREGKAVGFLVQPVPDNSNNRNALAKAEGPAPSEDLPEGVAEKDIVINRGGNHELYGKLTYPADAAGALPAVVLVHGSGAHDMDETISGNTPFKDIAYALSQKGIAVLRYNKVTYAYPEDYDSEITIDQETVDDAVAAKTALTEQADIAFSRIYVAGHSLGGMMAPRIASQGGYDGMILLAGSTRSLVEIGYDQAQYMLPISGLPEEQVEEMLAQYETMQEEADDILALPEAELKGRTVMNFPAVYIHSMDNPPPAQYIRELNIPMLILQGSKDFQVYPDKDFALYKEITAELDDVTMKEYEGLNHLFMPSFMEVPDTSEYNTPARVDSAVTEDIAEWVLAR